MKFKFHKISDSSISNLTNKFLNGDENSYVVIYELFARNLYNLGLSLNFNPELIEDAIHDVFVEIYSRKNKLENVNNLKAYLIKTFRNRLFFLAKKSINEIDLDSNINYNIFEDNIQEILIKNEDDEARTRIVRELLKSLNSNQREALYYRFEVGLNYKEIAIIMNINYQSVKNLIHRSISKLRKFSYFN